MYSLIIPNDKIKSLGHLQILDLHDYIYMRKQKLPATVKFKAIRSMVITEGGITLWQFVEKYLDNEFRPIGQIEAPVILFEWIINESEKNQ